MTAPARLEYRLSHTEFDICREVLRIEEFPVILRLPSPGDTHEERRRIVDSGLERLRARGLADGHGVHPDLADLLHALARPVAMLDARVLRPASRQLALGGVRGETAVLAVVHPDGVLIAETTPYRLAADVAAVAGPADAGPGESVSVPSETLIAVGTRTGADPRRLAAGLIEAGVAERDAHTVARMCEGIGTRGQFGAEAVGPLGGARHRAPRVVAFHDTPQGRYLQLRRPGDAGRPDWSTITPCSPTLLRTQLRELLDEAREHRPG